MPPIDLRTVTLLTSIMGVLMSIVLVSVYRGFPSSIKGLGHWAGGSILYSFAAAVFGMRSIAPDWLSVIAGNFCLLAGTACWLNGLQRFYGQTPARFWPALGVAAGTACICWWLLVEPNYTRRLASLSAILAVFYGAQFLTVARHGSRNFNTWFLAALMLILTAVLIVRCATSLMPDFTGTGLFSNDSIQMIYLVTYNFMMLLLSVGLIMIATHRLHTDLTRHAEQDPLTGLLNRRALVSAYERACRQRAGRQAPIALLLMDLDYFKTINDLHGHAVGDAVLQDFCRRVTAAVGARTCFARVGGEEFVILLPDTDAARAHAIAETVRLAVLRDEANGLPAYTCSIGVATMPRAACRLDAHLRAADTALYLAKSRGRNRTELADDALATTAAHAPAIAS